MEDNEFIKSLAGHSGCAVDLWRSGSGFFVRKSSGSRDYNKRLRKQFIKQYKFKLPLAHTPAILGYGEKDGIFYFDMEFVDGITMSEYMRQIKVKEIVDLMSVLFRSLHITDARPSPKARDIFAKKIASLKKSLDLDNPYAARALEVTEQFDFSDIPQSHCCGDLTLENIILAPTGKIYLIDLLDSFYNSWMIDVAKLLQDIDLGWSYRHVARDYNLNLRLDIAKQALFDNILALSGGEAFLRGIYHILLLNILRIYPYTKDDDTMNFLNSACAKIITTINEMEA